MSCYWRKRSKNKLFVCPKNEFLKYIQFFFWYFVVYWCHIAEHFWFWHWRKYILVFWILFLCKFFILFSSIFFAGGDRKWILSKQLSANDGTSKTTFFKNYFLNKNITDYCVRTKLHPLLFNIAWDVKNVVARALVHVRAQCWPDLQRSECSGYTYWCDDWRVFHTPL